MKRRQPRNFQRHLGFPCHTGQVRQTVVRVPLSYEKATVLFGEKLLTEAAWPHRERILHWARTEKAIMDAGRVLWTPATLGALAIRTHGRVTNRLNHPRLPLASKVREGLQSIILKLALDVAQVLGAWDWSLSGGAADLARLSADLAPLRSAVAATLCSYRARFETVRGAVACPGADSWVIKLLCPNASQLEALEQLQSIRDGTAPAKLARALRQRLAALTWQSDALDPLIECLLDAAIESLGTDGLDQAESDFDPTTPLASGGTVSSIAGSAGIDLSKLDQSATLRLLKLNPLASRIARLMPRPRRPKTPESRTIPTVWCGATPSAAANASRLNLEATLRDLVRFGRLVLHQKNFVLASWELADGPDPPQPAKQPAAPGLASLAFVEMVDVSPSCLIPIGGTPFTVQEIVHTEALTALRFIQELERHGWPVPDTYVGTFADQTILSGALRQGAYATELAAVACHPGAGGTQLDVEKILATIDSPMVLLLITDGFLAAEEATLARLQDPRIVAVHVHQIKSAPNTPTAPFVERLLRQNSRASATGIYFSHESDPAEFVEGFKKLVATLLDLPEQAFDEPSTQTGGHLVIH
jgi:hypothetical protein